jgi:hypothetical protein
MEEERGVGGSLPIGKVATDDGCPTGLDLWSIVQAQAAMKSTANWRDDGWGLIKPDLAMLQLEALASDPTAMVQI